MWKILHNYVAYPRKLSTPSLSSKSKRRVHLGNSLSDAFFVNTGVLQGDTLAPFLFLIVLNYVLRHTNPTHRIQTDPETILPDLDFAGDIVAFDSDETTAEDHVVTIDQAGHKVGLKINREKTKVFLVNYKISNSLHYQQLHLLKL